MMCNQRPTNGSEQINSYQAGKLAAVSYEELMAKYDQKEDPVPHSGDREVDAPLLGRSTLGYQLRQNPHRLLHLFIRIEEMRRHAQTDGGAAIDENFSLCEALDHSRPVFDMDHD